METTKKFFVKSTIKNSNFKKKFESSHHSRKSVITSGTITSFVFDHLRFFLMVKAATCKSVGHLIPGPSWMAEIVEQVVINSLTKTIEKPLARLENRWLHNSEKSSNDIDSVTGSNSSKETTSTSSEGASTATKSTSMGETASVTMEPEAAVEAASEAMVEAASAAAEVTSINGIPMNFECFYLLPFAIVLVLAVWYFTNKNNEKK